MSSSDATLALSSKPLFDYQSPEVSRHARRASHDVYDLNDPTLTTFAQQRQQPAAPRPSSSHSADYRPSSAADSYRTLRRVRRQPEAGQLPPRRAFSQDIPSRQPPQPRPAQFTPASALPGRDSRTPALRPALSEAQTDENGSTVDDPYQLLDTSYWPQRTTGVSSRTASAILYTLEDAIRRPFTLTTDWDEVNASMSEMVGVAGPAGPVGNGRVHNGAARAPPGPASGSAPPPSGVRTPTDIMRQRRDREARRKAEQEAREREQEELERQQLEQEQAQVQAEQYAASAAAADPSAHRRARASRASRGPEGQLDPGPVPAFRQSAPAAGMGVPPQPRPDLSASLPQQAPPQPATTGIGGQPAPAGFSKPAQVPPPGSQAGASQTLQQPRRVAFPHAFERWETLSSHWEGLTSYWIRKMEQNHDDLEKDPLSQQLARQITDLSAAGANLFHAVVELQRLRASSERKFQRWFFDTRSEQERAKEVQADLERQLKQERQGRADAFAAAQSADKDKSRSEELLREMRRELQISKEEARRAWEELGRREQEERDRTNSLRNGEPTLVGGVQVVPMIQGLPSRHNTRPPTRDGPPPTTMGAEYQGKTATTGMDDQYYEDGTPMSPTGSDPFVEQGNPPPADPNAGKFAPMGQMFQPESTAYPGPSTSEPEPDTRSYVGSSDAGDDDYRYDPHPQEQSYGYPAAPMSEESDEYDHSGIDEHHFTTDSAYSAAPTSAPMHAPYPPTTADYSGSGWGVGTGWEAVTPRHRHPTRLSDVLEEDEPSRTSPSRASQASRSLA